MNNVIKRNSIKEIHFSFSIRVLAYHYYYYILVIEQATLLSYKVFEFFNTAHFFL